MRIVFDLEWNQAAEKSKEASDLTFEVIELGAVKVDDAGQIVDTFERLVRPVVYPQLFYRVKEVVGLTSGQLEREGRPFPEVMEEFWEWSGKDAVYCTWGSMDLTELQKNVRYYGMENRFPFPLMYYDVQKLYSLQFLDGKSRCSLEAAVQALGLDAGMPFHRAEADAYYTALVMAELPMKRLKKMLSVDYFRVPSCRKEEIYLVFDRYSKFVSRAYPDRETAMQDNNATSTVCYRCGCNVKRRLNWFSDNTKHCYSLAYCPKHGWLRGKIRVKRVIGSDQVFLVKTLRLVGPDEAAALLVRQEELKNKRREKRLRENRAE
mgnify:CR=1 FL=1